VTQPPNSADIGTEVSRRMEYLRDQVGPAQRFKILRDLLIRFRDTLYPWMRILDKADGSMVVTISRPPADASLPARRAE
jgi:hypothetical protein